jgi:hypothetical protein
MARALFGLCTTIQTQVLASNHLEEILHDVHDLGHLEKDENLDET